MVSASSLLPVFPTISISERVHMMDGEEGFLLAGLGSHRSRAAENSSATSWSVEAFLDQCMQYHEQQEQERLAQVINRPILHPNDQPVPNIPITATGMSESNMTTTPLNDNQPPTQDIPHAHDSNKAHHDLLLEGTTRAMAVIERLKQQSDKPLDKFSTTPSWHDQKLQQQQPKEDKFVYSPEYYRQQREQGLAQEAKRRRMATLKNFEYLTKQHERKLHLLNFQIEQRQVMEHHVQAAQLAARQQRQDRLLQQQQSRPHPDERTSASVSMFDKTIPAQTTVALYISGLPTESTSVEADQFGSVPQPADSMTTMLTSLFAEFGSLKKIHLYRDKQTGQLKGDGLIVYRWTNDAGQCRHEFVQRICAEVSFHYVP